MFRLSLAVLLAIVGLFYATLSPAQENSTYPVSGEQPAAADAVDNRTMPDPMPAEAEPTTPEKIAAPTEANVHSDNTPEISVVKADVKKLQDALVELVMLTQSLKSEVEALKTENADLKTQLSTLTAEDKRIEGIAVQNVKDLASQNEALLALVADIEPLTEDVIEMKKQVNETQGKVAKVDPLLQPEYVRSDTFSDEKGLWVEKTEFRLRLSNKTGKEQPLLINGVKWTALTGNSFCPISFGNVAIQETGKDRVVIKESDWKKDTFTGHYYVSYVIE